MANDSIYSTLLLYHLGAVDGEDHDLSEMFEKLDSPDLVIPYVKTIKEEGNGLLKSNNFVGAFNTYTKAIKCLCCVVPDVHEGESLFRELAISLNLNLAICALKLHKPKKVKRLCSLVLELDDKNVKALYRRAQASKEIGNLEEALEDLKVAQRIEPKNKEISKELIDLQGVFTSINDASIPLSKTNQVSEDSGEAEEKRFVSVDDPKINKGTHPERKRKSSQEGSEIHCQKLKLLREDKINEFVQNNPKGSLEFKHQGVACYDHFNHVNLSTTNNTLNESNQMFGKRTFVNRRRRLSCLSISCADFKKLQDGKDLVFYHPNSLSVMRIRACTSVNSGSMETSHKGTMKEARVHKKTHISSESCSDCQMELAEHPHDHMGLETKKVNSNRDIDQYESESQKQCQQDMDLHVCDSVQDMDMNFSSKFQIMFSAVKRKNNRSVKYRTYRATIKKLLVGKKRLIGNKRKGYLDLASDHRHPPRKKVLHCICNDVFQCVCNDSSNVVHANSVSTGNKEANKVHDPPESRELLATCKI